MLTMIDQIREKTGMSYRAISNTVRLPYPSFIRWHMRNKKDTPKVKPPDFGRIEQDIAQLSHGHNRTQGTGALYASYASYVSRREMQSMVAMARHDLNASHRQNLRRIHWNIPNVAWSMDPCEYRQRDSTGNKVYLNQMQDLASRYKFSPMMGEIPCGEEISGYLTATFNRFGAPLFLKRDNGGNLNHAMVNDVLADYFVLPVNSPVYYPSYNGSIEEAQAELKNGLTAKLSYKPSCPREHLEAYAATVEHDLNHQPRPCLNGKNACQVYFAGKRTFTKWERRDAYAWITNLQNDMLCCEGVQPQAAWRVAVEAWLKKKGFITVIVNGKVLPNFF
jgi:transposase InsO family protein